jgi:AraC-like DNA-binding protein
VSFREFLTNIRFEHAVKEIAFTSRPVGQIVSDNGFRSLHRFSVLFRDRYGLPPGKWRHSIKNGTVFPTPEDIIEGQVSPLRKSVPPSCFHIFHALRPWTSKQQKLFLYIK